MQLHSISSHGEEYGHVQAETLSVTDSQSENEGKREKREKKRQYCANSGKSYSLPSQRPSAGLRGNQLKDIQTNTGETDRATCVGVCIQKSTKKSIFLQKCMSLGKIVKQGDNKLGFVLFSL